MIKYLLWDRGACGCDWAENPDNPFVFPNDGVLLPAGNVGATGDPADAVRLRVTADGTEGGGGGGAKLCRAAGDGPGGGGGAASASESARTLIGGAGAAEPFGGLRDGNAGTDRAGVDGAELLAGATWETGRGGGGGGARPAVVGGAGTFRGGTEGAPPPPPRGGIAGIGRPVGAAEAGRGGGDALRGEGLSSCSAGGEMRLGGGNALRGVVVDVGGGGIARAGPVISRPRGRAGGAGGTAGVERAGGAGGAGGAERAGGAGGAAGVERAGGAGGAGVERAGGAGGAGAPEGGSRLGIDGGLPSAGGFAARCRMLVWCQSTIVY